MSTFDIQIYFYYAVLFMYIFESYSKKYFPSLLLLSVNWSKLPLKAKSKIYLYFVYLDTQ